MFNQNKVIQFIQKLKFKNDGQYKYNVYNMVYLYYSSNLSLLHNKNQYYNITFSAMTQTN